MNTILAFYADGGWLMFSVVMGSFLLAGVVKGMVGLGLPTVSMGLLGLAMAPTQAAALLIVPAAITNIWQMAAGGYFRVLVRRMWPMLLGICIGTSLGTWALAGHASAWTGHALGVLLILYAVFGLLAPTLHMRGRQEGLLGPWVGLVTGMLTSTTGVFVVPLVPYLQSMAISRDELVQAMGIAFMVSTLALAGGLLWSGGLGGREAQASLLALLPAALGMALGQWLRRRISAQAFKRVFFIGLAALGANLAFGGAG